MTTKNIFVNLCVQDLNKSVEFFTKLGFTFNAQFTDETATSMIMHDNIFFMLIVPSRFKEFTKKEIVDSHTSTEVINAFSCESKAEVDVMFEKAIAAGGKKFRETEDMGFMYLRSFEDLDGHIWEPMWMDPATVQK